jgi:uncharacterized protein YndB with AHSA1/START domain
MGVTPERPTVGAEAEAEYGVLERVGDTSVLRYRRRLAHPQKKVWRALTEDEHLADWFPTTIEGDRAAGASLRFSFRQSEGPPFTGEMLRFDPPSVMELRWADDVLRFELAPDPAASGEGCVLDLTVTFPEYGKAARDAAGWHVCLERLDHVLMETALPWDPPDRWRTVHREYVGQLGPEASVIGPPEVGPTTIETDDGQ